MHYKSTSSKLTFLTTSPFPDQHLNPNMDLVALFVACLACMVSLVSTTSTDQSLLQHAYPPHHHHHHRRHHHAPDLSPVEPPSDAPTPIYDEPSADSPFYLPYEPPFYPPLHPPVKPKPPTKPPSQPPVKPPTKPPTYPPVKPPTKPPVKPPTQPPVKPPTKPPTYPPVKPPVKPPTKPPVKPPSQPPVKPPTKPPTYPPVKPPTKPPTYPPVKPPSQPPVKPPTYPPVKPPTLPPRRFVIVEGVVYCKSCKYVGIPTLLGASPLSGTVVELKCKSSKVKEVVRGTTDRNGYFVIWAPKTVTSYGAHKCKVTLVSSRLKKCQIATNLNFGATGSPLFKPKPLTIGKLPYFIYSAGPFAFEDKKKCYGRN
ncbi:unnamed protein product [Rhodiola kirilowii]